MGRVQTGLLRSSYPPSKSPPEALQPIPLLSLGEGGAACAVLCLDGGRWGCGPAEAAGPGAEASCLAAGHCLHRAPPGTGGASGRKGCSAPPPRGTGKCPAQLTEASAGSNECRGRGTPDTRVPDAARRAPGPRSQPATPSVCVSVSLGLCLSVSLEVLVLIQTFLNIYPLRLFLYRIVCLVCVRDRQRAGRGEGDPGS